MSFSAAAMVVTSADGVWFDVMPQAHVYGSFDVSRPCTFIL
jgi:hypothetical protein